MKIKKSPQMLALKRYTDSIRFLNMAEVKPLTSSQYNQLRGVKHLWGVLYKLKPGINAENTSDCPEAVRSLKVFHPSFRNTFASLERLGSLIDSAKYHASSGTVISVNDFHRCV